MSRQAKPVNVAMDEIGASLRRLLRIYTPAELAVMLECSESAVNLWRREETGPLWTRLGRRIYYRHEDVQKWMAENVGRPLGDGDDDEPGDPMKSLADAKQALPSQEDCEHLWKPWPGEPGRFSCARCGAMGRTAT